MPGPLLIPRKKGCGFPVNGVFFSSFTNLKSPGREDDIFIVGASSLDSCGDERGGFGGDVDNQIQASLYWSGMQSTITTSNTPIADFVQGFYDPINDKFLEPNLTGISYSFDGQGHYEEAFYRAIANRKYTILLYFSCMP